MDIDDWRNAIDEIDVQLVELLNRRSQCAIEIGRIKHERGMPVYSPSREAEVLSNVMKHNRGPLDNEAIKRLFERIIDKARRAERLAMSKIDESKHKE